jgi:CRP-like cAMP-binding protein
MNLSVSGANAPQNRLLLALPKPELERVQPSLQRVELSLRKTVQTQDAAIDHVYFIEAGMVSMVARLSDGTRSEVGVVGREGMVGLPLLLNAKTSPIEGVVQLEGSALRLSAMVFQNQLAELPVLRSVLLRYVDAFHAQVTQTAVCNSRHLITQRLARWLLMTHDRTDGDSFPITQEFLAAMLGVRRAGITSAMNTLQTKQLVEHQRRGLRIIDRPGLEATVCECYQAVQNRFAWLRPPNSNSF